VFVSSAVEDDVWVAELAQDGRSLERPFERATNSDANDAVIDWVSDETFAFVSTREGGGRLGIFEQGVGGIPRRLAAGPSQYRAGTAADIAILDGDAIFWRRADVPGGRCELVRVSLTDGREKLAVPSGTGHEGEVPTCGRRLACCDGECAAREDYGAIAWFDPKTGVTHQRVSLATLSQADSDSAAFACSKGRLALGVGSTPMGSSVVIARRDGFVEASFAVPGVHTVAFAPRGNLLATALAQQGAATVLSIDPTGHVNVLVPNDGRARGRPRVSPDGRRVAMTVRSRQMDIAQLDLGSPPVP
jgi:hypothetical protein